ncbi:MAG: hypothetical protein ABH803_02755 [Candidatus Micrarchaeota archaeon]
MTLLILDIDEVFRHMTKANATNNALKEYGVEIKNFDDKTRDEILNFGREKNKFFTERGQTMGTLYALAKNKTNIKELQEMAKNSPSKAEEIIETARKNVKNELTPEFEKELGQRFKEHNYPMEEKILKSIDFEHKNALQRLLKTHDAIFVTSSDSASTRAWLNTHGFEQIPLIGREDVPLDTEGKPKTKPAPHAYWKALTKKSSTGLLIDAPKEVIIVGDAKGDMDAAVNTVNALKKRFKQNKIKLTKCLVLSGKTESELKSIATAKPTHVFKDFTDFAEHTDNLEKLKTMQAEGASFKISSKAVERIIER